jgi:hypothetical protein
LHPRFAQTERHRNQTTTTPGGPFDGVYLMLKQIRVQILPVNLEAGLIGNLYLFVSYTKS